MLIAKRFFENIYSDNKFERCWKFWWTNCFVNSDVDLFSENFSIILLWYLNLELFLNLIFWFLWGVFFINLQKLTWKTLRNISDNAYFWMILILKYSFWKFSSTWHSEILSFFITFTQKNCWENLLLYLSSSSDIVFKLLTKIIIFLVLILILCES